jgi:hypothetical protein
MYMCLPYRKHSTGGKDGDSDHLREEKRGASCAELVVGAITRPVLSIGTTLRLKVLYLLLILTWQCHTTPHY